MQKTISLKILFRISLVLCFLSLFAPIQNTFANSEVDLTNLHSVQNQTQANPVVIYFFWGDGCPHCAKAKPFLEELKTSNPNVVVRDFEVWKNDSNLELFKVFAAGYGFEPKSVPTFFIGEKYWEGFNDFIQSEISLVVNQCLTTPCVDKGAQFLPGGVLLPTPLSTQVITPGSSLKETPTGEKVIKIPLIGEVNVSSQSLFVSTLLISFVDGFNPCSIWVLSMLLAITLHTGSRKKVLIIGFVFLTVTAAIYALFIAGLFTVFTMVSFVGWIQVVVAVVALFFAAVNIKDYFWYKEGVSFTIDDKKKPGIYQKIRKVMDAGDSFWGLIGGTIVLAAGVSLVEFTCTAGFPVLWTNMLTAQNVSIATFILLLLVYMVIYQLDELGIFLVAVFTLKSSKIEEKHGRILKLIGGVLMLTLAGVMLIKPSLMSDIGQSVIIFGIAFGVTLVILLVHRAILPRLGIYIGSELRLTKKGKK